MIVIGGELMKLRDIDVKAMEQLNKEIAVEMNLISVKNESENTFFTNKITEEKLSYLKLIFNDEFQLKEIELETVKKFIDGYYIKRNEQLEEDELDYILKSAIEENSSDIHIEPYEHYAYIRFRTDGRLFIKNKITTKLYNKIANRVKVSGNLDISKKLEPQDGKLRFYKNNKYYDIRISTMPTICGEKIVMRILYKNMDLINLNNLNFTKEQRRSIDKLLNLNNGIILVNGPTGSGKSTTLYAFVNSYNKESKNISTIEDPVEFTIDGIVQSNVNEKIGFNFSKGLKQLLRQDPDIILIGEIRDEETAKIAVRAAITGHKVLGTIHTNSAMDVYYRLLDMGVEPYLLKQSLKGAIAQRLIRKLCSECKEKIKINDPTDENKIIDVYRAKGCNSCSHSGYKGRIMISHVMDFSNVDFDDLSNINNTQLVNSAEEAMRRGEVSIDDYLVFREGELEDEISKR